MLFLFSRALNYVAGHEITHILEGTELYRESKAEKNTAEGGVRYSVQYEKAVVNNDIVSLIEKVKSKDYKDNEQAVPETKKRTLYVVTAFIGKKGYKNEASQLINAKSPDVTAKTGSVVTSNNTIPNSTENVKQKDVFGFKINENADENVNSE